MPRWASCLTLKISNICVERVQEISEQDALAEGGPRGYEKYQMGVRDCRYWYQKVWEGINKERGYGWDTNPFVWVITFGRCFGKSCF